MIAIVVTIVAVYIVGAVATSAWLGRYTTEDDALDHDAAFVWPIIVILFLPVYPLSLLRSVMKRMHAAGRRRQNVLVAKEVERLKKINLPKAKVE